MRSPDLEYTIRKRFAEPRTTTLSQPDQYAAVVALVMQPDA